MPELPEVESLRRSLLPYVKGKQIRSVEVFESKIVSSKGTTRVGSAEKKNEFEQGLAGEYILDIERRAKNLIFLLSQNKKMFVHLKMTGQLVFASATDVISGGHPIQLSEITLPNKHTRIQFHLSDGNLYYNDIRMFGYVLYYQTEEAFLKQAHFEHLGYEPDDPTFTLREFFKLIRKKSGTVKSVLMDQTIVVGLGNIYCDEVCFYAGVKPNRLCRSLKKSEIERLHHGIHIILERAISLGGSSVANYLLADGSRGNYAREHKVYGRSGMKCFLCETQLKKILVHGRTTVYCPKCQR